MENIIDFELLSERVSRINDKRVVLYNYAYGKYNFIIERTCVKQDTEEENDKKIVKEDFRAFGPCFGKLYNLNGISPMKVNGKYEWQAESIEQAETVVFDEVFNLVEEGIAAAIAIPAKKMMLRKLTTSSGGLKITLREDRIFSKKEMNGDKVEIAQLAFF